MSLFSKFTIRFNWTIGGTLVGAGTNREHAFSIELCACGAENPAKGFEIAGIISIEAIADSRPFIGFLTKANGNIHLAFSFSDDELSKHRFQATLQGRIVFGQASVRDGAFFNDDEDDPWGKVKHAQTGPALATLASLRITRRPRRPVFKDRLASILKRKPFPVPRRQTAVALAEAALPPGEFLPGGGEETIKRIEKSIIIKIKAVHRILGLALWGIEWLPRLAIGKRFSAARNDERVRWLENMKEAHGVLNGLILRVAVFVFNPLFFVVLSLLKFFNINTKEAHSLLRTEMREEFGLLGDSDDTPSLVPDPVESWEAQIQPSDGFDSDEVVEADAVVIGTGAGGAPVARELAERGFAVAIIEAGKFYRREDSTLGAMESTVALGNAFIFLPMGKAVGGSTFVNAGTCFRTPPEVLTSWGLPEFHPDKMEPHFDRVEEIIKVAEADPKYVGPPGEVIHRGSDLLEYDYMNLSRNAEGCEGKALCDRGCPHGAKQSTNRSYIPGALKSKASLFTGFKVREILTNGKRAIGVHAYGKGKNGKAVRLTVFAKAVILAAGTLHTPTLIQRNGLVRGNKWVGRNLSFHPATAAMGIVPGVDMRTHECIPQAYGVHEFRKEGLMFEGGNMPLVAWAAMQRGAGPGYIEKLERFSNAACFGYLVDDTSRGRVRPGPREMPLVTYWMNKTDLDNLVRGMAIASRIFFAAGADRVFAATVNLFEMRSEEDVKKFEARRWRPRDFILSAFHPLGTARVGTDPRTSVIDLDHQCHAVPGLFVTDGSAVPGSVGVNTQVTIMAVATRAGYRIADVLEKLV